VWGPDGERLAEGPQRYGLRHGRWTVWELEDGKRFRREGRYVMGVAQDLWTYWYENGQMASRGRLRDGQRDGGWTYWYENGAKMQSGACHADLEQGPWTYWNPDGSLSGEATYKDGELDGRQVFYEADGAMRIEQYRNGEPVDLSL
jgi:antitoxin component YwqK of YwqJK toxin-antitoxin module